MSVQTGWHAGRVEEKEENAELITWAMSWSVMSVVEKMSAMWEKRAKTVTQEA